MWGTLKMIKKLFLLLFSLSLISPVFSQGIDSDTKLIMHMDGANGGTTFGDDSTANNKGNATVTADVNTRTATKKWGTASAEFDGDSGFLSYTDSADWDLVGSNLDDWTIDCWVKLTNRSRWEYMVTQRNGADYWVVRHRSGEVHFYAIINSNEVNMGFGTAITDSNWHHIAMCKKGNKWAMYLDGIQTAYVQTNTEGTITANLEVGALEGGQYFTGFIEELRIQHSNYFNANPNATPDDTITVPTEAYSVEVITRRIMLIH